MRYIRPLALLAPLVALLAVPALLYAQDAGTGVARTYEIADPDAQFGDVISLDPKTGAYVRSTERDDPTLFGVLVERPVLVLESTDGSGLPIARTGQVRVNVTGNNGPIAVGEYVTTSRIPGAAERAEPSDTFVLGSALEPFPGDTADDRGTILIDLDAAGRRAGEASGGPAQGAGVAATAIQYGIAAAIALGALYFAYRNFGQNIANGVISIGRNPLAKGQIRAMVVLNVVLVVVVSGLGLFAALLVVLLPI